MSNPNLEPKVKELLELKRMREELDAEINAAEEEITWKAVTSSRLDSTALKKALPEIAARFMKQTTTRRFSIS